MVKLLAWRLGRAVNRVNDAVREMTEHIAACSDSGNDWTLVKGRHQRMCALGRDLVEAVADIAVQKAFC